MSKFFYQTLIRAGEIFQNLFLLAVRLIWGWQFFITGKGKLADIPAIAEFFKSLHIPFPEANAYLVGSVEMIGGALLFIGLFARLISLPLICTMSVAFLTADIEATSHFFSDPTNFFMKSPFSFLMAVLIIFSFGPGKISLDYLFKIEK